MKKEFNKFIAVLGSFLTKVIALLIPMKYPSQYIGTDIEEFKMLLGGLGDKGIDNLLRCFDIYIAVQIEQEIKLRMKGDAYEYEKDIKLQGVKDFRGVVAEFIQARSVNK